MKFKDRIEAGNKLGEILSVYKGKKDVVIAALPRGGVEVGRMVADVLGAPLDIVVPRKIAAPGNEEYAIGAVGESGEAVWNERERQRTDPGYLRVAMAREQAEARRRVVLYRRGMPSRDLTGKIVIVVDDGIATGLTMRAAVNTVRAEHPKKVIVAVPVAAQDSVKELRKYADEVVVIWVPDWFSAVGAYYEKFPQIEDAQVASLLGA